MPPETHTLQSREGGTFSFDEGGRRNRARMRTILMAAARYVPMRLARCPDSEVPRSLSSGSCSPDGFIPHPICRLMTVFPRTSRSILVRKKQSTASCGRHTMGSFSLNDVFNKIGTPVSL